MLILIGTKKGAFILEGDSDRKDWHMRGPYCEAWPLNHVIGDAATGTIYATGGNEWFGPAVWKSDDLGQSWTHSSEGLNYAEGEDPIKAGWSLSPGRDCLYAGVEPAGLFRSDDGGITWSHIHGLRDHPSRPQGMPGAGGLNLHTIVRGTQPTLNNSGSACLRWACFTPPMAARRGHHATRAHAPTIRLMGKSIPSSGSACIPWRWRPGSRTGFISRTIAACTAATMAA